MNRRPITRLSLEQVGQIVGMIGAGMRRKEIAHALDISDGALGMAMSRHGISMTAVRRGYLHIGACPYCGNALHSKPLELQP